MNSVRVVFLGTNGWYDTHTGNTVCVLIETRQHYIILDAGSGLYKFNGYARGENPVYLFLSHFHLDHIEGLHILAKLKMPKGLKIIGQKGTQNILNTIVNRPFTLALSELPYPVEVLEAADGEIEAPFPVQSLFLKHSSPTMGFRFSLWDKTITYCPDTGYCDNALKLAEGADLLIAECAYRSGEEFPSWPHLNPESAARLAREAGARQLALIHFDADHYRSFSDRNEAQIVARKIFANVVVTRDGMELTLR